MLHYLMIAFVIVSVARVIAKRQKVAADIERSMKCDVCGYDLRASPERCPECGTIVPPHRRQLDPEKLRDDWPLSPIKPREPGAEETPVRLWDAPHAMAANLLVEQLLVRGIRASIQRNVGPMQIGTYVTPAASIAVNVWSGDVEAANRVLERFTQAGSLSV